MYCNWIRPLLFSLPPETAHRLTLQLIGLAGKITPLRSLIESRLAPNTPQKVELFGLTFPNQLGLAAGYDKDAQAVLGLSALGFGHIEIGTITPKPQAGNPKPRIFRLKEDQGVINRMGFPGRGADDCMKRLEKITHLKAILGINIGKNKDTPLEHASQDYTILIDKLYNTADYFAINISSPNTVGLRQLQHSEYLDSLLADILDAREIHRNLMNKFVPLLVKLSPDMEASDLEQSIEVILSRKIDGIIATNTTITRNNLRSSRAVEAGGLSGKPISQLSNQVIAFILSVLICFLLYTGFEYFAYLPGLRKIDEFVIRLGINEHYTSMSRGVIDIRDITYYLAVVVVLNEATRLSLLSRKWRRKT